VGRDLTIASLLLAAGLASTHAQGTHAPRAPAAATVLEGTVRYVGRVPDPRPIDVTGDAEPWLQVDRAKGLRSAVVFLATAAPQPAGALPTVTITQRNYLFQPRTVAVREGQSVRFTNDDPASHSVRSADLFEPNRFNVYTSTRHDYVHRFTVNPRGRPVVLSCDIHDWMTGWIYVFDHPHFALTDKEGRFRLRGVPDGRHTLSVRHPGGNLTRDLDVTIHAGEPTTIEIVFDTPDLGRPLQ
jgi:plastocyanin